MTRPKRSRHRIPPGYVRPSDPISERYQAEVDASTGRLERAYRRAAAAAERAQERLARREAQRATQAELAALRAEVERRLDELHQIELLMQPANHASARHRGSESYGKVG